MTMGYDRDVCLAASLLVKEPKNLEVVMQKLMDLQNIHKHQKKGMFFNVNMDINILNNLY